MTIRTCALTGEESAGKFYLLKTTEGEETVSPEALFHTEADGNMGRMLLELVQRVQRLEEALEATWGAQPAKKAPAKKAPVQRKAVD